MKPRILLVDDERQFSAMTKEYLEAKNHDVTLVHSGDAGLHTFQTEEFDLCILDVRMPMKDGFTLAAEIRAINGHTPIIFLTGMQEKEDRIKGLTLGADDYITKPFSMEELSLRIQNILRRVKIPAAEKAASEKYDLGIYQLDAVSRELSFQDNVYKLTAIESRLLQMLIEHQNGVLDRENALKRIWGDDHLLHGRSLNVYVSKLRQLLRQDDRIEILNVHGVGYRLVVK